MLGLDEVMGWGRVRVDVASEGDMGESRLYKLYYIRSPYAEYQHWPLMHVLSLRLTHKLLQQRLELRKSFLCLLKAQHALWTEEPYVQFPVRDGHFDIEGML